MNSIYSNLNFTMETCEDFENDRLPTLDFELFVENAEIKHSFFEKPMNSPYVIMEKSAMSELSKYSILSNDLVCRLSNIGENMLEAEKIKVVNNYSKKLFVSGYNRKQSKEIIVSGIRGFKNKKKRAAAEGRSIYRRAATTLKSRLRKKLTEKTNWYKRKRSPDDEHVGVRIKRQKKDNDKKTKEKPKTEK